jgi:hypothetical protein
MIHRIVTRSQMGGSETVMKIQRAQGEQSL